MTTPSPATMTAVLEQLGKLEPAVQVSLVSLAITSVLSVLAVFMAWKSNETGRRKLKLDLFEKRFTVYTAIESAISDAWCKGHVSQQQYDALYPAVKEAKFLFADPRISGFLNDLYPMLVGVSLGHSGNKDIEQAYRSKFMQDRYYVNGEFVKRLSEAPDENHPWAHYAAWIYNRREIWSSLTVNYLTLSH
ncbi:hypothetical protein N7638_02655 [Achromobacter mucicolens]|uniref:hypothetical protein n=1 Tax=Achromobacter mucicolens TaxID=1389922 RepID=UPI00244A2191|nr:hypothetical protein [Achromobacter mucicolens]MDG9966923.1 hypothetical protein [Achromobacter mucicolens]